MSDRLAGYFLAGGAFLFALLIYLILQGLTQYRMPIGDKFVPIGQILSVPMNILIRDPNRDVNSNLTASPSSVSILRQHISNAETKRLLPVSQMQLVEDSYWLHSFQHFPHQGIANIFPRNGRLGLNLDVEGGSAATVRKIEYKSIGQAITESFTGNIYIRNRQIGAFAEIKHILGLIEGFSHYFGLSDIYEGLDGDRAERPQQNQRSKKVIPFFIGSVEVEAIKTANQNKRCDQEAKANESDDLPLRTLTLLGLILLSYSIAIGTTLYGCHLFFNHRKSL
jgi:hypothetical protein